MQRRNDLSESTALLSSGDREQRIAARRARIEARLQAKREGEDGGARKKADEEDREGHRAKAQTVESLRSLQSLKLDGQEEVSLVRVLGDDRENRRRIEEEARRQELRAKLLAETEASAKDNAEVAARWASLFLVEVPQDLAAEIETQKQACMAIVGSKERLILEIKSELKAKDDEYVRTLKRQAEDIDTLIANMAKSYKQLQLAFASELETIERAFLLERSTLLQSDKLEMDKLFEKRRNMEAAFMERTAAAAEDYSRQLDTMRVQDAEDYNILKIRLETDIQNLEQHLEAMRATYQLNTEKLEYNYRVLVERDAENQSTVNQQKRKIAKQRDMLSGLKAKYAESERRFMEANVKLTEEYQRITEQFKDLQNKFRHFQLADTAQYRQIWQMNEEEVAGLVRRTLQADKVIHEQQLGLQWRPPSEDIFTKPWETPSTAATTVPATVPCTSAAASCPAGTVSAASRPGGCHGEEGPSDSRSRDGVNAPSCLRGDGAADWYTAGYTGRRAETMGRAAESTGRGLTEWIDEWRLSPARQQVYQLLLDHTAFLLDASTRAEVAELDAEAREKAHLEAVLRILGVGDWSRMEELHSSLQQSGGELVPPDEAIRRLRSFVEQHGQRSLLPVTLANKAPSGARQLSNAEATQMELQVEREQQYWARMANVVAPKTYRIWQALEHVLMKYNALLTGRLNAYQELKALDQQNTELRDLLHHYMASKINEELQVPPTQLLT